MNRRQFFMAVTTFALAGRVAFADAPRLHVYKSPTCGCCTAWAEHMAEAGFDVATRDVDQDTLWALKDRMGITPELSSCHTAFVDGYAIEGHVPAQDVHRLLMERPEATGLTVPGMPIGSPGMEMGDQRDAYDVLLFKKYGAPAVFARH